MDWALKLSKRATESTSPADVSSLILMLPKMEIVKNGSQLSINFLQEWKQFWGEASQHSAAEHQFFLIIRIPNSNASRQIQMYFKASLENNTTTLLELVTSQLQLAIFYLDPVSCPPLPLSVTITRITDRQTYLQARSGESRKKEGRGRQTQL